jgi:hypothetical protein
VTTLCLFFFGAFFSRLLSLCQHTDYTHCYLMPPASILSSLTQVTFNRLVKFFCGRHREILFHREHEVHEQVCTLWTRQARVQASARSLGQPHLDRTLSPLLRTRDNRICDTCDVSCDASIPYPPLHRPTPDIASTTAYHTRARHLCAHMSPPTRRRWWAVSPFEQVQFVDARMPLSKDH